MEDFDLINNYNDLIKLLRQILYSSDKTDEMNAVVLYNLLDRTMKNSGFLKPLLLTQAEYDELTTKDSNTLYYVY